MWEPRHLTILQASRACYRDGFTFLLFTLTVMTSGKSVLRNLGFAKYVHCLYKGVTSRMIAKDTRILYHLPVFSLKNAGEDLLKGWVSVHTHSGFAIVTSDLQSSEGLFHRCNKFLFAKVPHFKHLLTYRSLSTGNKIKVCHRPL
jgi:hypothetical protein